MDYDEYQEKKHAEEVRRHNDAAFDGLTRSMIGDPLGGIVKGMKAKNDARAAEAAAREAEDKAAWNYGTEKASPIYEEALQYANAGDWGNAIASFERASGFYGAYRAPSYVKIADIYLYQKNDYDQAIFYGDKALYDAQIDRVGDGWPAFAHRTRGEAYFQKMARESGAEKERTKLFVVDDFKEAIDLAKKKSDDYKHAKSRLGEMGIKYRNTKGLSGLFGAVAGVLCGFIVARDVGWQIFTGGFGTFAGVVGAVFGFGLGITLGKLKNRLIAWGLVLGMYAFYFLKINGFVALAWILAGFVIAGSTVLAVIEHKKREKILNLGVKPTQHRRSFGEVVQGFGKAVRGWFKDYVGTRDIVFGILAAITAVILTAGLFHAGLLATIITAAVCMVFTAFLSELGFIKFLTIAGLIVIGGIFVYINLDDIKSGSFGSAKIVATTSQNANFRDKPSTDSNIIRQIPQGETITITGEAADGWTPIKHGKDTGWISSEFVTQTTTSNATKPSKQKGPITEFPAEFIGTWKTFKADTLDYATLVFTPTTIIANGLGISVVEWKFVSATKNKYTIVGNNERTYTMELKKRGGKQRLVISNNNRSNDPWKDSWTKE